MEEAQGAWRKKINNKYVFTSLVIALIMILSAFPVMAEESASADVDEAPVVEAQTYPYFRAFDDEEEVKEDVMTLYFLNGSDIPYMTL